MEKNNERISELNELFDELLEDATRFSKDFTVAINLLPFAGLFFIITGVVVGWIYLVLLSSNILWIIIGGLMSIILVFCGLFFIKKSFDFKKKYSKFYEIVKESERVKR